jgi:hypothetical protein
MMIRTKNHPFHEHHGTLSITIAILCLIPMDMAPFASVAIRALHVATGAAFSNSAVFP